MSWTEELLATVFGADVLWLFAEQKSRLSDSEKGVITASSNTEITGHDTQASYYTFP